MRLCLVGPAPPQRGGIARTTGAIYLALSRRFETRLVSFRRLYPAWVFPGRGEREPEDPADPLAPAMLPAIVRALDGLDPRTWTLAAAPIAAFQPDVVLIQWWTSYFLPLWLALAAALRRRSRARLLVLCHQVEEHEASMLTRGVLGLLLRRMDGVLVASAEEMQAVRSLAPGIAAATYGALPADGLLPASPCERDELRERLGFTRPTVLALGFVRPYKGIATLIRGLAIARKEADLALVIAGESWYGERRRLEAVARSEGVLDCVSFIDRYLLGREAAELLRAADIVAVTYERAGHSGVAGLAVEHGRPLLASRVGILPDLVEDGVSGYVVPPRDPQAVGRALVDFVRHGRGASMARAAASRRVQLGAKLADAVQALAVGGR